MTLELPDVEGIDRLSLAEVRLELACALYVRGRIGKVAGAERAGVNFFDFQRALGDRKISSATEETFANDLASLKSLFPS